MEGMFMDEGNPHSKPSVYGNYGKPVVDMHYFNACIVRCQSGNPCNGGQLRLAHLAAGDSGSSGCTLGMMVDYFVVVLVR